MSEPWVILTRRYGEDIRGPTAAQLAQAITEVYHEEIPGMTEGDYAEHGAAWLRYGFGAGPLFALEVNRVREVTLEAWADQGYEEELAAPRRLREVPEEQALRLWTWLAEGQLGRVQLSRGSSCRPPAPH
jgi:hypothetical protein